MRLLYLFLVLIPIHYSLQDCVINNNTPKNAWELQLMKKLQSNRRRRTFINKTEVLVHVQFTLKYFHFDSSEKRFGIYSWVFLTWRNDIVKWNPEDYGGITETVVNSRYFWTPYLRLYNDEYSQVGDHALYVPCEVHHDGKIKCVPRFDDAVTCDTKLTDWPYDVQECKVEFGVWKMGKKKVLLDFKDRAISMFGAEYGAEWDIIDYRQEEDQAADIQLRMIFVLERHAAGIVALILYPSIVLTILTLTSLSLDPRKNIRLFMSCFSLMNHGYFLTELEDVIPKRSFDVPTILLYYRGSVTVTAFLIVFTILLSIMCKKEIAPRPWMSYLNDKVFLGRWKYVIWPRWECEIKNKFVEEWINFANILNTVCFVLVIVVYISLYCVFMPRPTTPQF